MALLLKVARLPLPGAALAREIGVVWSPDGSAARLLPPLIQSLRDGA